MKISDQKFFAHLRANGGLYSQTAKAITAETGIEYSRQSVRVRALRHPDILKDINDEVMDVAEAGLFSLLKDSDTRIRLRAIEFFLKTKGKERGYVERHEQHTRHENPNESLTDEELDKKIEELEKKFSGQSSSRQTM